MLTRFCTGSDWLSHGQDAEDVLAAGWVACVARMAWLARAGWPAWVAAPALATGNARTAATATGSSKDALRVQRLDHFIVMSLHLSPQRAGRLQRRDRGKRARPSS
jgi:hypothetical protein